MNAALGVLFGRYPQLATLDVEDPSGKVTATQSRGRPVDERTERSLKVTRPLVARARRPGPRRDVRHRARGSNELETTKNVVARYHQLGGDARDVYRASSTAFAILLGITMLIALVLRHAPRAQRHAAHGAAGRRHQPRRRGQPRRCACPRRAPTS